ncbi:hypothetical protein NITHO_2000004 [Nitrolancea hollandica Lb]|uniref:Uncharacterized protein n=1 Tax=Nitrolancea hollandica Lb TaxID=1129897 RepID=I4EET1_9BACT|nr:hypothetical protein NITHO_2000004 [Nitrolancea hollandica Lb]
MSPLGHPTVVDRVRHTSPQSRRSPNPLRNLAVRLVSGTLLEMRPNLDLSCDIQYDRLIKN